MNRQKFSAIAHRDHDYCNPISAAKIERLLDLLPLDASSRVLDLGCGRAELALRIIERFGARVMAIDNSSLMLDAARERAEWTGALGRLHLDNVDIAEFQADPETFHLTVMLGAGGIPGGMAGICRHLKSWTQVRRLRADRRRLLGQAPASALPRVPGRRAGAVPRITRGNVQAGVDAGLIPMHATTASRDEWDEYEWKYCRSIERYAREQPDDPDVPADARADPPLARRVPALGPRHARLRRLSLLPARSDPRLTCNSRASARCRPSAPPHEAGVHKLLRAPIALVVPARSPLAVRLCTVSGLAAGLRALGAARYASDSFGGPSLSSESSAISSHSDSRRASIHVSSPWRAIDATSLSFASSAYASVVASQSSSALFSAVEPLEILLDRRLPRHERLALLGAPLPHLRLLALLRLAVGHGPAGRGAVVAGRRSRGRD